MWQVRYTPGLDKQLIRQHTPTLFFKLKKDTSSNNFNKNSKHFWLSISIEMDIKLVRYMSSLFPSSEKKLYSPFPTLPDKRIINTSFPKYVLCQSQMRQFTKVALY